MVQAFSPIQNYGSAIRSHDNDETETAAADDPSRRRRALFHAAAMASSLLLLPLPPPLSSSWAADDETKKPIALYDYENRDRKNNKDALIREDYWFMMGKNPPRLLNGPIKQDDPQWNAFGSCSTQERDGATSNSCTYVSLKQRIPIYSKYGFSIALGAREYSALGRLLRQATKDGNNDDDSVWRKAAYYVTTTTSSSSSLPPPPVDALLKMVLFASGMLTSPNYNGPNKRLLVARFYANEVGFALREIDNAIQQQDAPRAVAAWEFGKDSWNSYFQIVNEAVSPKVGDKFDLIT